jgi:hypothetical protein
MRKAAGNASAYMCKYFKILGQDLPGRADGGRNKLREKRPAYVPGFGIVTFRI